MSFRRNPDRPLAWKRWVGQHFDELTAAGVRLEIFSNEYRWANFLEEGGIDWESGWRIEMLSPQQAERLHRFLIANENRSGLATCFRILAEIAELPRESPQSRE
ncbi:MAG: hypothetical protein KF777_05670 [Planctomycetaceae bacterium]|nr:hypothetical protein [Planctomycetaceae bacterium]